MTLVGETGWVPIHPRTMATAAERVHALGDDDDQTGERQASACAGVFAHGQAEPWRAPSSPRSRVPASRSSFCLAATASSRRATGGPRGAGTSTPNPIRGTQTAVAVYASQQSRVREILALRWFGVGAGNRVLADESCSARLCRRRDSWSVTARCSSRYPPQTRLRDNIEVHLFTQPQPTPVAGPT